MSYDFRLLDPVTHKVLLADAPHQIRGGTFCAGSQKPDGGFEFGTRELWLNITYNHAPFFQRLFGEKGIRAIYGMTGAKSIPLLKKAIAELKDDVSDRYWDAMEGNAKQALCGLLALAQMRPDGIWDGD